MNIRTLYSAEQIQESVRQVAANILQHYGKDEQVIALCLLNGAIWFAADLLRYLPPNFELQTIRLSSYQGTESTGKLKWHNALPECEGKRVLVIDDVLDTGLTLKSVCEALRANGAADVAAAVAIQKNGCLRVDYQVDFCALRCDNYFLVGYGLDYNGKYRNLPYIGYVQPSAE